MLDLACFFTTGGVILFWKTFCGMDLSIVNEFIFKVLVQDKLSEKQFKIGNRLCIWKYDTEVKTVFLFVYDSMFTSLDMGEVLSYTKSYYKKKVLPQVTRNGDLVMYIPEFEREFDDILSKFNRRAGQAVRANEASGKNPAVPIPGQRGETKDRKGPSENAADSDGDADSKEKEGGNPEGDKIELQKATSSGILKDGQSNSESAPKKSVSFIEDTLKGDTDKEMSSPTLKQTTSEKKLTPKEKLELKRKQEAEAKASPGKGNKTQANDGKPASGGKVMRNWSYSENVSSKVQNELDYSKKFASQRQDSGPQGTSETLNANAASYFDNDEEIDLDFNLVSSDDEAKKQAGQKTKKSGILASFKNSFQKLSGGMILNEENLESTLQKFKDDLMQKNVAQDIARGIVESLSLKLIGKKVGAFESLSELVKTTLKETLSKILMPKKSYDILSEASKARERGEPYVVAFIGVNGVGKSTNLAKVAYLFKKQEFSVMFAACDNFRAGAVEQLKTHGRNLNIPVYDRGYKDEPHRIAKEAIKEARNRKIDVVLIDTAGRMQNNEPLMRALATLVTVNNPNLIVFIGEALVGNDGVDQLTNFNSALLKYSSEESHSREIDAILISKFDTVDEKVGAAISMTYATGKPILFFGTGQKYPNLKKPEVDSVVKMLLS